jgi:hypothetical protein
MSNPTRPWWADRSRRLRLEGILVALVVVVGASFLAGTNFGGGGSAAGEPTGNAAASGPAMSHAPLAEQGSTAPSASPEASPSSGPTTSPTSRSTPTPRANPTPKPTPRPTPTSTPTPAPTPTPTGLTGVQTGKHLDLTWQASAGAVTYDVYRGKGSGLITLLAKGVTKTSYRDLAVTAGTSYSYQVRAISSSGTESRRSRIFTITIM